MKKIKILSLLFCVVMLVAACHDDEEGPIIPQPREQVGRTVLVNTYYCKDSVYVSCCR